MLSWIDGHYLLPVSQIFPGEVPETERDRRTSAGHGYGTAARIRKGEVNGSTHELMPPLHSVK